MVQNISDTSSQTPADNQSSPFPFKPLHFIIIVFLLLILSALGTYLAVITSTNSFSTFPTQRQAIPTDTLNEMQNWKTYTNNIGSYSFKYPSQWDLKNSTSISYESISSIDLTPPNRAGEIITISVI